MSDEAIAATTSTTTGTAGAGDAATSATQAPAASTAPAAAVDQSAAISKAATESTATATPDAGKPETKATEVVYDLKLPTGSALAKEALPQLAALAKSLNMSPEQAQKFVDHQNELVTKSAKEQEATWKQTTSKWESDIKADPVIGGSNLDASKRDFDTALGKTDKGFRELLEQSGYVAHPAVRRELSRMGKLMREDGFTGNGGGGSTESREVALKRAYPSM